MKYPQSWEELELKRQSEAIKHYVIMFLIMSMFLLICLVSGCLADVVIDTIAYESSGETFQGQIAVSGVIKQRAIDRKLSHEAVVLQRKQFSCWKDGKPTQKRKLTPVELATAKKAWDEAKAEGYNHYHTVNVMPYWAKGKQGIRIGNHIFYKL